MKRKRPRLLRMIVCCIFATVAIHAQETNSVVHVESFYFFQPLPDSTWNRMSVREKLDYSFKFAENPTQLCGYWPVDSGRNEQAYIYRNTHQLFFLGEFFYSKRQHAFFDQNQDSIAWFLREDLFENKKNLYYWHNIIRYMKPNKPAGLALMEYYRWLGKRNSIPLTLLMRWMEYDSFPAYLQLSLRNQLDKSRSGRVYHNEANKEKLLPVIEKYLHNLESSTGRFEGRWYNRLYDSLSAADPLLRKTCLMSDELFNRLNAAELLAYCYRQQEHASQICGLRSDYTIYEKIGLIPDVYFGTASDFSERQRNALMDKRSMVAWLVLKDYREGRVYGIRPEVRLLLLLHIWQVIPDLLKMDRLKLFNRVFYLPVFCQFMFINRYPAFLKFWEKESSGGGTIPRTKKNEDKIIELAAAYYEWKMMTDGEEN